MTREESNKLARLEQKVDDLPLVILDALDQRYYTRREGRVVTGVIGFAVVLLTFWDNIRTLFK